MISSERNKVQKGGKSSARANERKTAHLEQQSTQTELQKKNVRVLAWGSSILKKVASRVKRDIRTVVKKKKKSQEDSSPIGSQDAMQKTKAEVYWNKFCQRGESKGKSPHMLEDWLGCKAKILIVDPIYRCLWQRMYFLPGSGLT